MQGYELVSGGVRAKLDRLRQKIRSHLIGEGASWVIVALVGLVFVTLLFDWGLHRLTRQPIGWGQRSLILGLSLCGVLYITWRFLLRRIVAPLNDDDLALVVEKSYPRLQDRLISAVQFTARWRADEQTSVEMVLKMAEQADQAATGLDFQSSMNRKRLGRHIAAAVGALVLLAGLAIASPNTLAVWFQRNVLLSDSVFWPQNTYLEVSGGRIEERDGRTVRVFKVYSGDNLLIRVEATRRSSVIPPSVTLHAEFPSLGKIEPESLDLAAVREYRKQFESVSEPFRFHFVGGDARTLDCFVEIEDPPELQKVEFDVMYPGHMNRSPETFRGAATTLRIPPHSQITIRAECTKPLRSAVVMLDGQPVEAARSTVEPIEGDLPVESLPEGVAVGRRVVASFDLLPAAKGQSQRVLQFSLTDADGATRLGGAKYRILVAHDNAPVVKVTWMSLTSSITDKARIPMFIHAEDDHGVVDLSAMLSVRTGETVDDREIAIASFETPVKLISGEQPSEVDLLDMPGSQFGIGDVVRMKIQATDSLPPQYDGPNRGFSDLREFKVVSEAELLAELLVKQKEMSERMREAISAQLAARDRMNLAREQVTTLEGTLAEARRLARASAQRQQVVASAVSSVLQNYRDILAIMRNNRAGEQTDHENIRNNIIAPLKTLSTETFPALAAEIDATEGVDDQAALAEDYATLMSRQDEIRRRLEEIQAQMARLESIQDFDNWLRRLIQNSQNVRNSLMGRLKDEQEKMGQPSTQPDAPGGTGGNP